MNERIQAYFDGAVKRDDLDPADRVRADEFDARTDRLREALTSRAPAGMDEHVMRRIADLGLEPLPASAGFDARRWFRALWAVRETRLVWRPVYAFAAMLVLLFGLASPWLIDRGGSAGAAGPDGRIYVQFSLHTGDASAVALAGSFNNWEPTVELQERAPGLWTALVPIQPGVHDYAFIVDGEQWVPDPHAPRVDDGFGGANSRLLLAASEL